MKDFGYFLVTIASLTLFGEAACLILQHPLRIYIDALFATPEEDYIFNDN